MLLLLGFTQGLSRVGLNPGQALASLLLTTSGLGLFGFGLKLISLKPDGLNLSQSISISTVHRQMGHPPKRSRVGRRVGRSQLWINSGAAKEVTGCRDPSTLDSNSIFNCNAPDEIKSIPATHKSHSATTAQSSPLCLT